MASTGKAARMGEEYVYQLQQHEALLTLLQYLEVRKLRNMIPLIINILPQDTYALEVLTCEKDTSRQGQRRARDPYIRYNGCPAVQRLRE